MIHSTRISKTLSFLEKMYQDHSLSYDRERPIMFAKLAILEYCGWVEAAFDEIAICGVRNKLRTRISRKHLEDKIKGTYGFSYAENARPLLLVSVGTDKLMTIEREMNKNGDLQMLTSNLGTMNKYRKEAAHTFTNGRTTYFQAPSVTAGALRSTEPILQRFFTLISQ
jgi:hypothetical protein